MSWILEPFLSFFKIFLHDMDPANVRIRVYQDESLSITVYHLVVIRLNRDFLVFF